MNMLGQKDEKVKTEIIHSIETRIYSIQECYRRYRNNPFNKAYVHRLRVELRKLRALINFLKPLLKLKIYKQVNGMLRDLGKQLSPLRDLDTLIEICSEIAIEEPNLIDNYADVFSYLESERYNLANKGTENEFIALFDTFLLDGKKILQLLEFNINKVNEESFEKFVQKRYKQKAKKLKKRYKELDLTDYEKVHEVRKKAKKVRYSAVGFKKIIPSKERKPIKKNAKYIQEHLGEITDVHVSIELLENSRNRAPDKLIKESLQKIIERQLNLYYK